MRVEARAISPAWIPIEREATSNAREETRREEVALDRTDVIEFVNELRKQFFKDELLIYGNFP